MDKFLFTDGRNGLKEAQSQEELQALIEAAEQPDKIRIWLFSSNEWISYAAFRQLIPSTSSRPRTFINNNTLHAADKREQTIKTPQPTTGRRWVKKVLYLTVAAAGVFLIVNFTKIKWEKAEPLTSSAARPLNVPLMDIDSLIYEIENERGQSIDRNTKTNLRLRNTWPDRILLQVVADKETSSSGARFSNVDISIDNTTGFLIDNAAVMLKVWNNSNVSTTDTLVFTTIRFDKILKRPLNNIYKGDSISVSFEWIKAKAFNFCYSAKKNNSGNYNDRWFCRE
jgi:hypothetical protein